MIIERSGLWINVSVLIFVPLSFIWITATHLSNRDEDPVLYVISLVLILRVGIIFPVFWFQNDVSRKVREQELAVRRGEEMVTVERTEDDLTLSAVPDGLQDVPLSLPDPPNLEQRTLLPSETGRDEPPSYSDIMGCDCEPDAPPSYDAALKHTDTNC